MTGGAQNEGGYSNPQVDQLLRRLQVELSPAGQLDLEARLDTLLWSDLSSIPLYAFPALLATSPNVRGVQFNPTLSGVTYNAQDWTRSG
jgi:peptide/nickel transport system substrate-binding protein